MIAPLVIKTVKAGGKPNLRVTKLKSEKGFAVISGDVLFSGQFIGKYIGLGKSKEQYMRENETPSSYNCMYQDNTEQFIVNIIENLKNV